MTPRKAVPAIFQGLESGLKMFRWIVLVLLVLFLFSGVQKVTSENVGLLLRFGRLQGSSPANQIKQPGLVLALPYPVDSLLQVPVKQEGEVTVKAGDNVRLDITLGPKVETRHPCTVTGTVIDGITGKPFSYAVVEAGWVAAVSVHKSVSADENGRFKIELPEGKVKLDVRVSGSARGTVDFNISKGETVEVRIVTGGDSSVRRTK